MEKSFISAFLPEGILEHFEITTLKELGDIATQKVGYYLYLDEKNTLPEGYSKEDYESKGFYDRVYIQDFPIRGKAFYLAIRRRRWRSKIDKNIIIKSDYSFISEGSKLTVELTAFLKGTGRDPRRYDK